MSNYNKKAWKRKSQYIRKRDGYECVECRRKGKVVDAVLVHHINPTEERPDLFWEDKNLISLCGNCHELMHNRYNNTLTRLGVWYKDLYRRGGKMLTKIKFIVGPPCSGKSTYVRERAGRNDIVFDLDDIVKAITLNELYDKNPSAVEIALMIRDLLLRQLEMGDKFDTAWIITTKMSDKFYDYYLYNPEVITMTTTKKECLKRLSNNPNGRNVEEIKKVIESWFSEK